VTVDEPRREHFKPYRDRYTSVVCAGPKFLASMFVSNASNDEERRKERFAGKLLGLIREDELPYSRVVINNHVLDEAATRLKKKHCFEDAYDCVNTVRESMLIEVRTLSENDLNDAYESFMKFDDHEGAMTDFLNKTFVEASETPYVAVWDDHYEAFDDLRLLPNCDYT
jgi:predicted nucleic acid-binding protein